MCGPVFVCVGQVLHGSSDHGSSEQDSIPDNLRPLSPLRNQINGSDGHRTDRHTNAWGCGGSEEDVRFRWASLAARISHASDGAVSQSRGILSLIKSPAAE